MDAGFKHRKCSRRLFKDRSLKDHELEIEPMMLVNHHIRAYEGRIPLFGGVWDVRNPDNVSHRLHTCEVFKSSDFKYNSSPPRAGFLLSSAGGVGLNHVPQSVNSL